MAYGQFSPSIIVLKNNIELLLILTRKNPLRVNLRSINISLGPSNIGR